MRLFAIAALFSFSATVLSAATLTQFDNRAAFTAAAGRLVTQDFNAQPDGASYNGRTLRVGDFTITASATRSQDRNVIDHPPARFSVYDVDGTVIGNVVLTKPGTALHFDFDRAITAFGLDLGGMNYGRSLPRRIDAQVLGQTLELPRFAKPRVSFFGVTSDTPFTRMSFVRSKTSGGFGFDNLSYSAAAPVPAPAAAPLLILALGGLVGLRRFKR